MGYNVMVSTTALMYQGGIRSFLSQDDDGELPSKRKAAQNAAAKLLLMEGFFCEVATALFDTNGVVAMFLSAVGASTWQIGVMSAIGLVGMHLPQVFVAARFQGRFGGLLVKLTAIQWLGTLSMAAAPVLAYTYGPGIALACFMLGWCCFSLGEGATFVPWSDAIASTVGRRCTGFLGKYGFVGSLGTTCAGMIVLVVVRSGIAGGGLAYALIFGLGSLGILITVPVLSGVQRLGAYLRNSRKTRVGDAREVGDVGEAGDARGAGKAGGVGDAERSPELATSSHALANSSFRAFVGAWLLSLGIYLAAPFVLVYGCRELGLTLAGSGIAVWTQMIGITLGSVFAAHLAEQSGSGAVVRLSCISSAAVPLFVMLPGLALRLGFAGLASMGVPGVMAAMLSQGIFEASSWVGCTGYVVEHAGQNRSMIIAVTNLMALPFACLGPLGGLLIKQAGYAAAFGAAAVPCIASALVALRVD